MTRNQFTGGVLALGVIFVLVLAPSLQSVPGQPLASVDRSTIVLQLVPLSGGTEKLASGMTGRPAFDRLTAVSGVATIERVFPVQPPAHPLSALAEQMGMRDWFAIPVPDGQDPDEFLGRFASCPDVLSAEFDVIQHIAGADVTPDDPYFLTHQYSLHNTGTQPPWDPGTPGADIEIEPAWDITDGDTSVVIAIIDTGVDFGHPEFDGRIWINADEGEPGDGIDLDGNGYPDDRYGYDFVNHDPWPLDDHQHGSHVAGIAAASGNNGTGTAGINWKCRIMALKVLGASGSGSSANIAEAITYAVNEGADVINLSIGGGGASVEHQAINYAIAADVVVCAAMGNDNTDVPSYPAAYDSVVSVGATNPHDERALGPGCPIEVTGSNFGPWIDVCAAGERVWSTIPVSMGSYGEYCLTSQATPHVVGLASLILSLRPDYTADSVRRLIRLSAEDQVGRPEEDTPGFDIYHGWGRINARSALRALAYDLTPVISVPGAQAVTELETLAFTVTAQDSNYTTPALSASSLTNATFTDNGDGSGSFEFTPDITQQGNYEITFVASDGTLADTGVVAISVADGCLCPYQSDFDEDSFNTALDLSVMIDILFAGHPDDQDEGCPSPRADFDCDGFSTALDLSSLIDHLFAGGDPPCDPCSP